MSFSSYLNQINELLTCILTSKISYYKVLSLLHSWPPQGSFLTSVQIEWSLSPGSRASHRCRAGGSLAAALWAAATEGLKPRALSADSGRPEFLVLRKIWSLWREVSISLGFHLDSTAFNMSSYILVWSNLLGPNAAISSKISLL